jgi:hypothetical protein
LYNRKQWCIWGSGKMKLVDLPSQKLVGSVYARWTILAQSVEGSRAIHANYYIDRIGDWHGSATPQNVVIAVTPACGVNVGAATCNQGASTTAVDRDL